ncbi:leucine-rich repeat-containing protein 28 [Nematostella vectensis]|uniref:leucine-rich repeat-containing protein 28 n=1 Tax=Nematostella vectensis TaxID=45351 RepID=UPI0020779125|nr:leucine-rich repeat-containing protein 28 [Nematostella vectensis]
MNNNLHQLPWQLSDCVRLETLLFDGNLVEWLPQQLTDLKGLKELSGSRNRLLSLPQDIDKLVSLESLLLDSNPGLFFLPGNLLRLKHLHTVGLNGCNQRPSYEDGGNPYPSRGIRFVGSEEHCVLPLLELSARVVHTDQTLPAYSLPSSLSDLVKYPTAHCYWCGEALFTCAFLLSAHAESAAAIVRCTDSWEPVRVCSKVSMEFVFLTCSLKCSRTVKQNL